MADKLGKHNVVADFMSRLAHTVEQGIVEDAFLDENLSIVSTETPFLTDMENYLAIGKFPRILVIRQVQNL